MTFDVPRDSVIADTPRSGRSTMMALNAGAVIVAGLYFGRELLVPLVLAAMLAFVLGPACKGLQRIRLPRVAAVLVAVVLAFAVLGGIGMVVGRQVAVLAGNIPAYEKTVVEKWQALTSETGWLRRMADVVTPPAGGGTAHGSDAVSSALGVNTESGLAIARSVALPLLGPLGTAGVVLVFTIVILLSSEDLRDRLVRLVGRKDLHRTILAMNDAARRLSRYFLFQLGLNTCFGVLIGLSVWAAGLPNPVLWGILAALMRFVPYIGTVIALAPPLLLAVAVVPGWSLAMVVLALFIGAELIMGQVVEPLIYGHSTGISPFAVIVATAFWAFLWGPVGLLLATPLTVCLVVIGRHVEPLAFLDVILGDSPPLDPPETFYQRALEGSFMALMASARQHVATSSLAEYYDTVALPGLALAQGDLARDALAFERLEAVHSQIEALLHQLGNAALSDVDGTTALVGQGVVCIPGRGQLDDLAADMTVQVLRGAGFDAMVAPNLVLGSADVLAPALTGARLCCLSVIDEGSSASGIRYFVRRIQRRLPQAAVAVCLWHAAPDSPLLAALRAEGQDEHLVRSISELLALVRALARTRPAGGAGRPRLTPGGEAGVIDNQS